jgi:hypothetical protein
MNTGICLSYIKEEDWSHILRCEKKDMEGPDFEE